MTSYRNETYDNRNTNYFKYQSYWYLEGTYNASNTGESGTLATSNLLDANVTFVFPEAAKAFYYYGMRRSRGARFGICIDCDPNQRNFEEHDALNATDDGKNPPAILFSRQFGSPGVHEIILKNLEDPRFNNSQISIERFVLEVERDDVTTPSSSAPASQSPSSSPDPTPDTSSKPLPVGAIVGAAIGGVVGLLAIIIAILLYLRRRKRWKDKDSLHSLSPFVPREISETGNQPPLAAGATTLSLVNPNRRETDAGRIDHEDGDILPPDYDQVFAAPVEDSPAPTSPSSRENHPPFEHRLSTRKSDGPISSARHPLPNIPSGPAGPARRPSLPR